MDYERSLVSAWDMSTINPVDLSYKGYGNHGTGVGLVAATDIVEGIAGGRAIQFDGSKFINVGNDPSLDFTSEDFSWSLWIKLDALGSDVFFFKGLFDVNGYYCQTFADGRVLFVTNQTPAADQKTQSVAGVLVVDEWIHLTITRSGGDGRIYKNGVEPVYAIKDSHIDPTSSSDDANIAAYDSSVLHLVGIIDSVRVYDTALTPLQVNDLMVAQRQGRK